MEQNGQQQKVLEKSLARIQRAVDFCRRNNYAANNVFGIIAAEGFRLRIRLVEDYSEEESKQVLEELQSFIRFAASEGLSIQAVETFLYSRGATFEVVDAQGDVAGVINLSEIEHPMNKSKVNADEAENAE